MNKVGEATSEATPATTWRSASFDALEREQFDLLVIGGGITGCGVARDAAMRGLRVALCEKDDFASGTSSRSSRLIHGGVRYLEHGHLHLVFESSRERRRLLRIAPHLVHPLSFTWPVYDGARVAHWKLLAGLTLYDALALFRNVGNHRRLSRDAVIAREPALLAEGLQGGARYWDASTNDARLTLANAMSARALGATVVNHARAVELTIVERRVNGATIRDKFTGRECAVRASCVVSASGPWTDAVQAMEEAHDRPTVLGSAGVHIAVPRERVENREAVTLVAPQDGRVFFVLPAEQHAIIGTTELPAAATPDEVRASRSDVRYLLDAASAYFPRAQLRDADVVAAWSGIRPLAATLATGDAGSASREHTIAVGPHGMIAVTGGKLTTYRAMAEEVVDHVTHSLGAPRAGRPWREESLWGGVMTSLEATEEACAAATGDVALGRHLARTYGSEWRTYWAATKDDAALREPIADGLPYETGEGLFGFSHEMAGTIADVLLRRTHVAFETRDHGLAAAQRLTQLLAPRLGWSADRTRLEQRAFEDEMQRILSIDA